jgi:hypothetical protein
MLVTAQINLFAIPTNFSGDIVSVIDLSKMMGPEEKKSSMKSKQLMPLMEI